MNLVKSINKAAFEQLGKFKLIDEQQLGYEFRYYIPKNNQDKNFERLQELAEINFSQNYEEAMQKRIKIEDLMRRMSARTVTFRLQNENLASAPEGE